MGSNQTIRVCRLGTIGTFARTNGPTDPHRPSLPCSPGHGTCLDIASTGRLARCPKGEF